MPKKKLTKTQVKKAYRDIGVRMSKLIDDKLYHDDSLVPQSMAKLMDQHNVIFRISKKL
tara:strand:- start:127 stop:303 length:177 start_codon:yes stop_codon:yes gene_type:complete